MWLVVCAALAAAGGCTCGEPAIAVDLTVVPSATTTPCVRVVAVPDGAPEQPSGGIPRPPGKDAFEVAVYQRDLPQTIHVLARGFEDPGCTRLNEESPSAEVTFVRGKVPHVPLHLNGSPCVGADAGTACPSGVCRSDHACADAGTEFDCTNNVDDDLDGKPDCLDPDCFNVSCDSSPDLCMLETKCLADGGCGSATFKACDTPTAFCLGAPGTCNPSTGVCAYAPDAGIACFDSNPCTDSDHCLLDAGCGGVPVVCNTPPGACFSTSGTCSPSTGCSYPVRVDGGCDDGDLCTVQDRCSADAGCAGTRYTCSGTQCTNPGSCLGDGGCSVGSAKTGQLCDGGTGVCGATAACLGFPYVPSNFNPGQIAQTLVLPDGGLPGPITLNCPAWFNSTDAGISWCPGQPLPSVTAITQNDGTTPAVVLGMMELTVNNGSLQVFGNRPVILAVWGDVSVTSTGTISARSVLGADAGAGAMASSSCGAQDGNVASMTVGSGGGGGSYATGGGSGGDLTMAGGAQGGNGGASNGNASIIPLRGGCGGGTGGRANDTGTTSEAGGAGGGAIQISVAGTLTVDGAVTASGGGGRAGLRDQTGGGSEGGNGGGGGGSGGAVLLEANDTLMSGSAKLTANGGGGGQGGDSANNGPTAGGGGDGPTTANSGGPGGTGSSCGSAGTNGGSVAGAPVSAGNIVYQTSGCATGGGGGSAGRIRVNGHAGCQVDAGIQSPLPSFTGPCP